MCTARKPTSRGIFGSLYFKCTKSSKHSFDMKQECFEKHEQNFSITLYVFIKRKFSIKLKK